MIKFWDRIEEMHDEALVRLDEKQIEKFEQALCDLARATL